MITVTKSPESSTYLIKVGNRHPIRLKEICLLYDYVKKKDSERKIRTTLHAWAWDEDQTLKYKEALEAMHKNHPSLWENTELRFVKTDQIKPRHLEMIIDSAGWLATWHEAFVLGQPNAISSIMKFDQVQ